MHAPSSRSIVALLTDAPHYLDHVGVLAWYLKIPLWISDPLLAKTIEQFYPAHCTYEYCPNQELMSRLSFQKAVLGTGRFFSHRLQEALTLLSLKTPRLITIPHGASEKGAPDRLWQDVGTVYGRQLQTLFLRQEKRFSSLIYTGNFRAHFYQQNRLFFHKQIKNIAPFKNPTKPLGLIAPSWDEFPEGMAESVKAWIEASLPYSNIWIKLHPLMWEKAPQEILKLIFLYDQHPQVVIIQDTPLVYPFLSAADWYLGGGSSVGYDFLFFDKPLFLYPSPSFSSPLSSCAICLQEPNELAAYLPRLGSRTFMNALSIQRQMVYAHTFSRRRSPRILYQTLAKLTKRSGTISD